MISEESESSPRLRADEARSLVDRAAALGVILWAEDGQVRYRCKAGAMPAEVLIELKRHRAQLYDYLSNSESTRIGDATQPRFRLGTAAHSEPILSFRKTTWEAMKSGQINVDSTNGSAWVVKVRGQFDVDSFELRCRQIMRRHDATRASAVEINGSPHLRFDPSPAWAPVRVDMTNIAESSREAEVREIVGDLMWRPFDLANAPLFRAFAITMRPTEHVLGIQLHHFVSDGMSMEILQRELATIFSGNSAGDESRDTQSVPVVQYSEYLASMNAWLASPSSAFHVDFWRRRLAGAPPITPPRRLTSMAAPRVPVSFDARLSSSLHVSARAMRTTPCILLLAAQYVLLSRLTGLTDVTIGFVILGREIPGLQHAVGYLTDRVYYRVDLSGDPSFADIAHRVRAALIEATPHQFVRSDIVKGLMTEKRVVAPMFNFRSANDDDLAPTPTAVTRFPVPPASVESRTCPEMAYWLTLKGSHRGIRGHVRFGGGVINGIVPALTSIVTQAVTSPDRKLNSFSLPDGIRDEYAKSASCS